MRLGVVGAILSLLAIHGPRVLAQELDIPDLAGSSSSGKLSLPSPLQSEAQRYVTDGKSLLMAPLHWDGASWTRAALAVASIALLAQEDSRIDTAVQRNRTATTN